MEQSDTSDGDFAGGEQVYDSHTSEGYSSGQYGACHSDSDDFSNATSEFRAAAPKVPPSCDVADRCGEAMMGDTDTTEEEEEEDEEEDDDDEDDGDAGDAGRRSRSERRRALCRLKLSTTAEPPPSKAGGRARVVASQAALAAACAESGLSFWRWDAGGGEHGARRRRRALGAASVRNKRPTPDSMPPKDGSRWFVIVVTHRRVSLILRFAHRVVLPSDASPRS